MLGSVSSANIREMRAIGSLGLSPGGATFTKVGGADAAGRLYKILITSMVDMRGM